MNTVYQLSFSLKCKPLPINPLPSALLLPSPPTFLHFPPRNNNSSIADYINIKILNAGAWARTSERIPVSLPRELEDYIPEVEEFYKRNHSGRKLQWHHLMSNGVVAFENEAGRYDLEITTFQMAVLFAWNQRPKEQISFENLRLATGGWKDQADEKRDLK
jgi:hypothetical protein